MHEVPPNALVVVADSTGARVFRNQGDARAVSLHQFQLLELMNMDDDGPAGRVPAGATGYPIDQATFAKQLAQRLNDAALKGCLRRPGADRRRTDPWRDTSDATQGNPETPA